MHTNTDIHLHHYKRAVECAACVYIVVVQHMRVFMNVPVCVRAPRQASLSLHPGCGHAWGSHRGVFINEKPPAPPCPCLLTASCHNHQMPPNTQIHRLPPPLLCQAVVAASVASSVTGEVPCYYGHCCRSATLWLCSRHQ